MANGAFGVGPADNGVEASAAAKDKAGVVGTNVYSGPVNQIISSGPAGVFGVTTSDQGAGVLGLNENPTGGVGVEGRGATAGVDARSNGGTGIRAISHRNDGAQLTTHSNSFNGVFGNNTSRVATREGAPTPVGNGVFGYSAVPNASGVCGAVSEENDRGAGVTGIGPTAGRFFGHVDVIGDITCTGDIKLTGADLAEHFELIAEEPVDSGTVVVLEGVNRVRVSSHPYDHRVAGVLSGGGSYRPGILLDHANTAGRPLALAGKVYCRVDASATPVEVGDLLTTSATPGCAMKATDASRAFGAVLGKAMAAASGGVRVIPILVALH